MSETKSKGPWLVEGNVIYKLRHAGWHRGVEQLENEYMVSVHAANGAPSVSNLVKAIATFLNAMEGQ